MKFGRHIAEMYTSPDEPVIPFPPITTLQSLQKEFKFTSLQ